MWKKAALGAATLVVAGSMFAYAQQQGGPGFGGARNRDDGMRGRHFSAQDLSAFADARIAALHAGLQLNADQEKNWPAFEQALREMSKMRIARIQARQQQQQTTSQQPTTQQPAANPIERLQKRADAMTTRGAALKRVADAAAPLYQSLDDAQKQRFTVLARIMRRHDGGQRRAEWRGRGGPRWQDGMRGEFRGGDDQRGFGNRGMRNRDRRGDDQDNDYRGPL
jgi:zinc resistance-associated protein